MNTSEYGNALSSSFQLLWPAILSIGIRIIVAVAVFIIGWIIGAFLQGVIVALFKKIKVDVALERAGLETTLKRGGITLNSGVFVGALVKWFIIVIFLISSFQILGLPQMTEFLAFVAANFIPRLIVGVLILLVAVVIGDVLQKIVRGSAGAAGIKSAALLGTIAKWIIWIFAVLAVLDQLGIGADLIRILFTGFVVAGAIAFGIAFGLGGQDHASKLIQKVKEEVADEIGDLPHNQNSSHSNHQNTQNPQNR